eukprot:12717812-Ditylum_brightwellii.AAC.1
MQSTSSKFEFSCLIDHSCGHDQMRPDDLNVFSTNVGFGDTAKHMHHSIIQNDDADKGPFWMIPAEQEK